VHKNIVPSSIAGSELEILVKHYVKTHLRVDVERTSDAINLGTFQKLIMRSCLIDEIKQRLISKPGKEWTISVFNSRDSKFDKKAFDLKKLIYGNNKMFKPIKHVTWKGLPPIEEDELRAKKKMLKDAPKGVENENL